MGLAAVAFEGVEFFAFEIKGAATAAIAGVVAVFTLDDEEGGGAAAEVNVGRVHAGLTRQVVEIDDHRDLAGVHVGEVGVRCFARVIPRESAATGDDALRQRHLVAEDDVAKVIEDVRAPVAHFAVAGVPIPMPVVVEALAEERLVLRRAKPEIVIHRGRRREGRLALPDGFAHAVVIAAHVFDFSEHAAVEVGFDFILQRIAALLRAALHDAVVFARGFDELAAFPDVVGDGFLDVNVFPGFHGPNRGEHVPVIAGGDDDAVDGFVFHDLAEVLGGLRVREDLLGFLQLRGVRVAKHRDLDAGHFGHASGIATALTAESDAGEADFVIRAEHAAGGERGEGEGGLREEGAA